ncbi:MAG: hypothetical protein ACTSQP_16685 [Promethearchaeota archaeon]
MEINELKKQLETKDNLINTLQDAIKLKDDQINTIKESMSLKDEQIKTLEESLKIKEQKIQTLQKSLELKEEQLKSSMANKEAEGSTAEKDKIIEDLKKEVEILNEELAKADEDIESLEKEIEELRKSKIASAGDGIVDFTHANIPKEKIIERMREILQKALHNVMITAPTIEDLQDLYLYEARSSVNMKISCAINPGIDLHAELLEEFESLDNISLRAYEGEDRYLIVRDGEELLLAIKGSGENNHLVFTTKDPAHIKFLNAIAMESWLRGRKI